MKTIQLNEKKYIYTIERQARKTLLLQLLPDSTLFLKAPNAMPLDDILAFVRKKSKWIAAKDALLANPPAPLPDISALPFLGRDYPLQITKTLRRPVIRLTGGAISVNLYAPVPGDLPSLLENWYRRQALTLLTKKTALWAKKIGVTFNKITLKDQKTRWGSCSSLGNINYNWRIIMAPESAVDYLVIHELCHRIHLNHSADFWKLVQLYAPDYKEQKLWLKQHGQNYFEICPNTN